MKALKLMTDLESAIRKYGNFEVIIPSSKELDSGIPYEGLEVSEELKMFLLCSKEHLDTKVSIN